MDKNRKPSEQEYEGVPKTIEVLGVGHKYGLLGGFGGFALGALFSGSFVEANGKAATATKEFLQKIGINIGGKTAIMLAGGGIVSKIVHWVTVTYGYRKGAKIAGQGHAQFEHMKNELNETRAELNGLKEQIGTLNKTAQKSFSEDFQPRESNFAAAVEAQKEHTTEIVR